MTYYMFQTKLRALLSKLGLDSSKFSSHSFRRGGATLAFRAGVPADQIQVHGDWSSDAYRKYLTFSLDDKFAVTERMNTVI